MQLLVAVVPGCRQTRLLALLALLSSLFLLALGTLWLSRTAHAAPVSPTAPGSIAGAVTNQAGVGLADIDVRLWRDGDYSSIRRTTTDANGNYRFAVLAPGIYRVEFVDPAGLYAFQFYPAATILAEATLLFIAGDNLTGIDTQLPVGGVITGIVTGTEGVTLDSTQNLLRRMVTPGEWQEWERTDYIAPGSFRFSGLATGLYSVCALGHGWPGGSFNECYEDGTYDTATAISVTAGLTTANITILLGNHNIYTQVKGRVTSETGQPIAHALIQSYDADDPRQGHSSTGTTPQGDFRIGFMQGGHYFLRISDPTGLYAPEFYNNVLNHTEATVFHLRDDSFVDGINISLTLASHITGTVLMNNQIPPEWGTVKAMQKVDDQWRTIAEEEIDRVTGHYHIGGLLAGTYTLLATGWLGRDTFVSAETPDQGRVVTVAGGAYQRQVNFALGEGAYEGSIQGTASAAGVPLPGIRVELYRSGANSFLAPPIYYLDTNSDGSYHFGNLLNGSYLIRFVDPAGRYATIYYPNQPRLSNASTLTIQGKTVLTNISAAMQSAGSISGRVTRYDGTPIAGATITPYFELPMSWEEANRLRTTSDAQGNYRLTGLTSGSYFVHFSEYGMITWPQQTPFESSKYYGGGADPTSAVPVAVTAGQTTTNISMILGPEAVVQLPLIQR